MDDCGGGDVMGEEGREEREADVVVRLYYVEATDDVDIQEGRGDWLGRLVSLCGCSCGLSAGRQVAAVLLTVLWCLWRWCVEWWMVDGVLVRGLGPVLAHAPSFAALFVAGAGAVCRGVGDSGRGARYS